MGMGGCKASYFRCQGFTKADLRQEISHEYEHQARTHDCIASRLRVFSSFPLDFRA